jgi:uncharacterized protein (DUF697 family)
MGQNLTIEAKAKTKSRLYSLNPVKLAHYEKENYVAYYQKDWLKLLRVSVGMVKESFGLSTLQAIYGAYLVARAEIAFAPFPDNDVPLAEATMRRFFAFIKKMHGVEMDVERAARVEVNWWGVHRKLFGQAENQELVDAIAIAFGAAYNVPVEKVQKAAYHRAQGMLQSDLWVNQGKPAGSPLLALEEEELAKGYTELRSALNGAE